MYNNNCPKEINLREKIENIISPPYYRYILFQVSIGENTDAYLNLGRRKN